MNILGFDYPDGLHYLLERDMWAQRLDDGRVRVGVTAFGVKISGHFFMCRPKAVGTAIDQGATIAVAELNKSVVTIKSPASGVVDEVNAALADTPELIEHDPYQRGWIAVLRPTRWDADLPQLAHGAALPALAEQRMRLENLGFSEGAA
ncbi:MAG: glycine cleavage system protein H [Burkholderiaceae bacterium]